MTQRLLMGHVLVLLLLLVIAPASANGQPKTVDLTLSLDEGDLVVREPVKVTVLLRNVSPDSVRVVELIELNNDMEHFVLEVQRPDGTTEYRRNVLVIGEDIFNPDYRGELLPPHGTIHVSLYPLCTSEIDIGTGRIVPETARLTFDVPGTYVVRIGYFVPPFWRRLWRGENGIVFSNSVVMRVRTPTPDESDLLDALWANAAVCASEHDRAWLDEKTLRRALQSHEDGILTLHVRFALARSLASAPSVARWQESKTILLALMSEHPEFRREEVHTQLRYVASNLKEVDLALEVVTDLLEENPDLRNDYRVVQGYLVAKTGSFGAVHEWLERRKRGHADLDFMEQ